ncbi:hypothetical protein GGR58DRAFT_499959 [Xylaria digitata]|nr:hypothetical protein GGR58DRAFT_499959 [Xylaria digitata]
MDIVQSSLSGLKAVYDIGKFGWEFWVETQNFGENYQNSRLDLRCQEWAFSSSLDFFTKWISLYRVGSAQTRTGYESEGEDIAKKIRAMVNIFNDCYEVIRNYDNEWKQAKKQPAKLIKPPPVNSALSVERAREINAKHQQEKRQARDPQRVSIRDGEVVHHPLPAQVKSPFIRATGENMTEEIEKAQKNSTFKELVSWASHGKVQLDNLINQLKDENRVLEGLLRNLEPTMEYDPFQKIRQSKKVHDLWAEQERVRTELTNLHHALCDVNPGESAVQLAVKLEEDFSRTKSKLEHYTSYVSTLRRRSDPMYVWLMEVGQGGLGSPTSDGVILSTTVSRYDGEDIPNLAQKLADMNRNNQKNEVIGVAAIDETHKYHLQIIKRPKDLASNQKMSEVILDNTVRREERICLTAQMALSHNHFMSINQGVVHRHLDSYYLYGPSPPKERKGKWDPKVLRTMFVEFGFGRAVRIGDGEFPSDEEYNDREIDHAVELGLLIYQASAGEKLDYDHTRSDIARQREAITHRLGHFQQVNGLYMREIIEVCFLERKQETWNETVVSEVAVALRNIATRLKNPAANP